MSIDIQNSWYMSKPLSECKSLFSKEETINYHAHFYQCQCGAVEVVLSSNTEITVYQCEACDNMEFINAYNASKGYFYLQLNKNLNLIYECKKIDDGYMVNAYLEIPYQSDFLRKKLFFKKEFISSLAISFSNKEHIFYLPLKNFKEKDLLKKKLLQFIINDTGSNLLYYRDSLNKEVRIYSFIFSPNLVDTEFYFWKKTDLRALNKPRKPIGTEDMFRYLLKHRKERSLKRALFEKYTQILVNNPHYESFNPLPIFITSRCFDDLNIALKLLKNDCLISKSPEEDVMYSIHDIIWLLKFLKRYYEEKQIAKMLLDLKNDWYTWSDIISMVPGHKRIIKRKFKKVKLTLKDLHDEMIDCTIGFKSKVFDKLNFSYEENYKQACRIVSDLEFRLPSTSQELNIWAEEMHNCIFGYRYEIKERRTTIYGAFKDNKLLYVIEVSLYDICEMSDKCNSRIPIDDHNIISEWWGTYLFDK